MNWLKLKLQYFGHLMQREDTLEKTLLLGKTEGRGEEDDRGWDNWMASPTQWTWVWASSGRWWRTGKPGVLQSMASQRVEHDWATERQQQTPCITWDLSSLTRDWTSAPLQWEHSLNHCTAREIPSLLPRPIYQRRNSLSEIFKTLKFNDHASVPLS